MAISNYSELQTAIANWINRDDLTDRIKEFIALGEARIYRELRIRAMEKVSIITTTSAIPSDYIEHIISALVLPGNKVQPLEYQTNDFINRNYPVRSADSRPKYIARAGINGFVYGPYPDTIYTVSLKYYARLPSLSDSNTTNWFTSNAPDILLWASLVESHAYIQDDERIQLWEAKYQQSKNAIQKEDNVSFRGSGPMSTKTA